MYNKIKIRNIAKLSINLILTFRWYLEDQLSKRPVCPDKKGILVTGCDSGYGYLLAKRFAGEGHVFRSLLIHLHLQATDRSLAYSYYKYRAFPSKINMFIIQIISNNLHREICDDRRDWFDSAVS